MTPYDLEREEEREKRKGEEKGKERKEEKVILLHMILRTSYFITIPIGGIQA